LGSLTSSSLARKDSSNNNCTVAGNPDELRKSHEYKLELHFDIRVGEMN
jgi:hypothetical protein